MSKLDGKPLVKQFADDLWELLNNYHQSGLTNSEAMGVLETQKLDIYMAARSKQRPF